MTLAPFAVVLAQDDHGAADHAGDARFDRACGGHIWCRRSTSRSRAAGSG